MSDVAVQSEMPGGHKGEVSLGPTSIDLTQPNDIAMVCRAAGGNWDVPAHIRAAVCEQLGPAIAHFEALGTPRAQRQLIKLGKLAVLMDAQNMVAEGMPKSQFPYLRRRNPERRSPRNRTLNCTPGNQRKTIRIKPDPANLHFLGENGEMAVAGNQRNQTVPPISGEKLGMSDTVKSERVHEVGRVSIEEPLAITVEGGRHG